MTDSKIFQVPENFDLNQTNSLSQKRDGTAAHGGKQFPKVVFNNLPPILRDACNFIEDDNDRNVFFVGLLGVLSGMLPNVKGSYNGLSYESNLYVYVIAPYGEGKSSLKFAKTIAMPIERKKRALKRSKGHPVMNPIEQHRSSGSDSKKIDSVFARHFIPANISKTGFIQLIAENGGRGTLFESEGDTVADTLSQDYGHFSDVLRNAFQHETVSYFRRENYEDVEIESPFLSVILSSTVDQMRRLIPSVQNGLFSRFLFYSADRNPEFVDVFQPKKREYLSYFESVGNELLGLYDFLSGLEAPINFDLTDKQKSSFLELLGTLKRELGENVDECLEGSANRLGLMCFRIAMILTAIRSFQTGKKLEGTLICDDADFVNAIRIIRTFTRNMLDIYWKITITSDDLADNKEVSKAQQKEMVNKEYIEKINRGETPNYRQIALRYLGSETKHQTVYRWTHQTKAA
jgi:hypothetical protein